MIIFPSAFVANHTVLFFMTIVRMAMIFESHLLTVVPLVIYAQFNVSSMLSIIRAFDNISLPPLFGQLYEIC